MLVTPEGQIYNKPSAQNPFAYHNLGYCQNPNAVNNNQANQVVRRPKRELKEISVILDT